MSLNLYELSYSTKPYIIPTGDGKNAAKGRFSAIFQSETKAQGTDLVISLPLSEIATKIRNGYIIRGAVLKKESEIPPETMSDTKIPYNRKAFLRLTAVLLDFDEKEKDSEPLRTADEVRKYITDKIGQDAVSIVNESSGSTPEQRRWHAVLFLKQPVDDFDKANRIYKYICGLLDKQDKAASDVGRLHFGMIPQNEIIQVYGGTLDTEMLNIPEVQEEKPLEISTTPQPQEKAAAHINGAFSDDDELLDKALKIPEIYKLFNGDISDYNGDHSRADLALCGKLLFWARGDKNQVDRVFRRSALMRDKWNEVHSAGRTYGQMTVDKAYQGWDRKCYDPNYKLNGYSLTINTSSSPVLPDSSGAEPMELDEAITIYRTAPGRLTLSQKVLLVENYILDYDYKYDKSKTDDDGNPIACGFVNNDYNIRKYLHDNNLLYDLRYNEFSECAEVQTGKKWRNIDDDYILSVRSRLYSHAWFKKLRIGKDAVLEAVKMLQYRHSVHPIKDYLNSLKWDGVKRAETILIDTLGAEDTVYTREATMLLFRAMITRAISPGTQFDYMIILQGGQGYGKTSFFRDIVPDFRYYGEIGKAHLKADKKAFGENAEGKWLMNVDELDGFTETQLTSLKSVITALKDSYKKSYDYYGKDYLRHYIIVGTTNNSRYLTDPTGNRRFLPILIMKPGRLDPETVNQLWAEAYQLYLTDPEKPLLLSEEAERIAETMRGNATALICDDYIEEIQEFLDMPLKVDESGEEQLREFVSVSAIYAALKNSAFDRLKQTEAFPIIKQALDRLEWVYSAKSKRPKGNKPPETKKYWRP